MKLYRMPLGALGTNCYIVVDESNQHCLVVDPGGEGERLVALLKEKGLATGSRYSHPWSR